MDAASIALSGLRAQSTKLAVSAENIATADVENATPKQAVLKSDGGGGVRAEVTNKPNVDGLYSLNMIEDIVSAKTAEIAYKADISMLKTTLEMESEFTESI